MNCTDGKKLGVLGGMGSKASAYFYNLVVDLTDAKKDQDHINAIYLNCACMPDRTQAILDNDTKELKKMLMESVKYLEGLGVSHIAIPCNTSHYFWEDIQGSVGVPVINMVKETLDYVSEINDGGEGNLRVGLLATSGTVRTGVYEKYLGDSGIEIVYPSEKMQDTVMNVIYQGVKGSGGACFNELDGVIEELRGKGCKYVILGCTELSVLYGKKSDSFIIDALDILARRAIGLSGKKLKV